MPYINLLHFCYNISTIFCFNSQLFGDKQRKLNQRQIESVSEAFFDKSSANCAVSNVSRVLQVGPTVRVIDMRYIIALLWGEINALLLEWQIARNQIDSSNNNNNGDSLITSIIMLHFKENLSKSSARTHKIQSEIGPEATVALCVRNFISLCSSRPLSCGQAGGKDTPATAMQLG